MLCGINYSVSFHQTSPMMTVSPYFISYDKIFKYICIIGHFLKLIGWPMVERIRLAVCTCMDYTEILLICCMLYTYVYMCEMVEEL